jgi:signal transduction histidine kinase/CheY-like chemotaxis protein
MRNRKEKTHKKIKNVQEKISFFSKYNLPQVENELNDYHITVELLNEEKGFSRSDILKFYQKAHHVTSSSFFIFSLKTKKFILTKEFADQLNLKIKNNNTVDSEGFFELFNTEDKLSFFNAVSFLSKENSESECEISYLSDKNKKKLKQLILRLSYIPSSKMEYDTVLCVATDVSSYKYCENKLKKEKENAETADTIKTLFLTNIAHEIRTPMNAIIGFTELLNIGDLSAEKRKEYTTIIRNKSKHLLTLIDDIAELSKFETKDIKLNKSETNIVKLLNELHQEFNREKIQQKKQNVDLYLKLPIIQSVTSIYTDSGRIHQVMSYLLDNALKYTERGYIQFGFEFKDNRHIQFFVKDTGIGIHKEAQKYLFNRFRIKEEVYSKKYSNFGLGLTISNAIVELMGGKIHVDSSPGQGTNLYFTIPIQKSDRVLISEKSDEQLYSKNWRNKVILVAEDDEVNFRFIEAVFADTKVKLIHVLDGKQAVDICRKIGKIDLILMDIKMPEKSGYEAIKEIRKFKKDIPIIAQTAYTHAEDRIKCMEVGCNDYISKPIDIELLFSKINKFFNT